MNINSGRIVTDTFKTLKRHLFAVFAIATLGTISALSPVHATTFEQQEVDQSKFIAIAVPRVGSTPQLIVLEQIASHKACWKESGSHPVDVEPLLLKFDFMGICGRSTDSNGYSIRMANQDLALLYSLSIVKRDGQLVLIGKTNTNRNAPVMVIGRTHGISSGITKIVMEPGWRFTKRTFNGQTLDHVYLTNDKAAQSSQSVKH